MSDRERMRIDWFDGGRGAEEAWDQGWPAGVALAVIVWGCGFAAWLLWG